MHKLGTEANEKIYQKQITLSAFNPIIIIYLDPINLEFIITWLGSGKIFLPSANAALLNSAEEDVNEITKEKVWNTSWSTSGNL